MFFVTRTLPFEKNRTSVSGVTYKKGKMDFKCEQINERKSTYEEIENLVDDALEHRSLSQLSGTRGLEGTLRSSFLRFFAIS